MNIFDIARLAGVSRKTVQRVLNGSPSVKPETKEKIRQIMERHHYEPNAAARRLTARKSRAIGIFIIQDKISYQLHSDDLYFGAVIGGIVNMCAYKGYNTMITILDVSDPAPLMSLYKQKNIDAGIVVSWSNVQEIVQLAVSAGFPIGVFDQNNIVSPPEDVWIPRLDDRTGGYEAGRYLLELGYRDLGIITGDMAIACSAERLAGFLQAAAERGIGKDAVNIHYGRFMESDGEHAAERWHAEGRLPRALFCSNDLMAYGALRAFARLGVRVPGDVAVVGFDDLLISKYTQPPLTTLRVPRVEMAEDLTARLIAFLEGAEADGAIPVFKPELVRRGSCESPDSAPR